MAEPGATRVVEGTAPARVLIVTIRRLEAHAAWCSNYEFEDVVRTVDDVDLLELQPVRRRELGRRLSRALAFRGVTGLNPGVAPAEVRRDYDLMLFVGMNAWDLLCLNALRGWRRRCRKKIAYLAEFYVGQERELAPLLRLIEPFDVAAQAFRSAVEVLAGATGRPWVHVPLAVDGLRFTPFPAAPERVIDVLSVGRRSEPVHAALLALSRTRGLFYQHDTIAGPHVVPARPAEHREMYAAQARRSRLFVAFPAKFGAGENRGVAEVGARYFEATAAGAVPLGAAPASPAFREHFPFDDTVVEVRADGADTGEVVQAVLARPDALARVGVRNAVHTLRHHDWAHRWKVLLEAAGVAPRPALADRLSRLDGLAAAGAAQGAAVGR